MAENLKLNREIVRCFLEVQKENLDAFIGKKATENDRKLFAENILKKAFKETRGDFGSPTRKDYLSALKWLMETAPPPKDPKKAEIHRKKIFKLIDAFDDHAKKI